MKKDRLDDMVKGWFIGNFSPTIYSTPNFEVAVKKYKAGDVESSHYHKLALEITCIISGSAYMNDVLYSEGDIITLSPGDITDFKAVTDTVTVVVKTPSVSNDKYVIK